MSAFSAWQRRRSRSDHNVAKELVVFGNPVFQDPKKLNEVLFAHDDVLRWARERDVSLSNEPDALVTLDGVLDKWASDSTIGPDLANEVGVYLGNIIVGNVRGARWTVLLNGHPVVGLASGRQIDVTELVDQRLRRGGRSLPDIYSDAKNSNIVGPT
jgi:Family of unknown function (DUF6278)